MDEPNSIMDEPNSIKIPRKIPGWKSIKADFFHANIVEKHTVFYRESNPA